VKGFGDEGVKVNKVTPTLMTLSSAESETQLLYLRHNFICCFLAKYFNYFCLWFIKF